MASVGRFDAMPDGPLDISELGKFVKERRTTDGVALREAAAAAGVSFNTLSRVERGHVPDMATFRRIADWLGVEAARFFEDPEHVRFEATPDVVAQHLRLDPALSDEAAEKIAGLVRTMYSSLATPSLEFAVHLRAAQTFRPAAADLLADLLQEMQSKLNAE